MKRVQELIVAMADGTMWMVPALVVADDMARARTGELRDLEIAPSFADLVRRRLARDLLCDPEWLRTWVAEKMAWADLAPHATQLMGAELARKEPNWSTSTILLNELTEVTQASVSAVSSSMP